MGASEPTPLVVDLDGTLITTDVAWEGLVRVAFERPGRLPGVAVALLRGRAAFKAEIARAVALDTDLLPLRPSIERLIRDARAEGRPVILATAAHETLAARVASRVGADHVLASDGRRNLRGRTKLDAIREMAGEFDYAGNAAVDLPLLRAARRGYLVGAGPVLRRRAASGGSPAEVLDRPGPGRLGAWIRALRPHQWSKNLLLLLPVLAAHPPWTRELVLRLAAALAALCLVASALYLLNDLADLPHDRRHPTKRRRPLAAGSLSIPAALGTSAVFLAGAGALALFLPGAFAVTLAAYAVLNLGYSGLLKRLLALDVVVLAGLYTIRVVAGAAVARIPLTGWFLAFAVFLFLSLALLKRCSALVAAGGDGGGAASEAGATSEAGAAIEAGADQAGEPDRGERVALSGRAYRAGDLPVLRAAGLGSALVAGLVYCLYIAGPVRAFYSHPQVLWVGLPIFLYWVIRAWLLAGRGQVHEDPVVFVLRDPPSYVTLAAFLAVVYLAR